MAKSKTYTYTGETPGVIMVPGLGRNISVEPGDTVEAESDAEAAAFEANPDMAKGAKKDEKGKEKK